MFRNNPTPFLVGAAVAAVLAALVFQGKPTPSSAPADSTKATGKDDSTAADNKSPRFAHFIDTLFGEKPAPEGPTLLAPLYRALGEPPGSPEERKDQWPSKFKTKDYHLECLIADVPHPTKSGLGYWYDLTLDALQRAFAQEGFILVGAGFPSDWPAATAKAAAPAATSADADRPAILVFRKASVDVPGEKLDQGPPALPPQEFRVVLLVGESPTTGLQRAAFRAALQLVRARGAAEPTIRVIGPFFSGTQPSFLEALREAAAPQPGAKPALRICNGSATSVQATDYKRLADDSGLTVDYRTTIVPDALVRRWLFYYLSNPSDATRPNALGRVAFLKESNTGYGQFQELKFDPSKPGLKPQDEPADAIEIPFPIHISSLQAAYNKEFADKLTRLGLPPSSSGVSVPQDEGQKEGDSRQLVASQSPGTTTAVNDLIIRNLLTTLSRERIGYVGLVATDPRDKILLGTVIRETCPDVQVFTTGGDLLMAHPDFNTPLAGMVVGSCYPLDAEPQTFLRADGLTQRRLLFGNQGFQGYFNAVLAQLAPSDPNDPLAIVPNTPLLGYDASQRDPATGRAFRNPTVWIGVLAHNNAIVPVYKVPAELLTKDLETAHVLRVTPPTGANAGDTREQGPGSVLRFSAYWVGSLLVSGAVIWWLLAQYLTVVSPTDQAWTTRHPWFGSWFGGWVQRLCLNGACLVLGGLNSWLFALALLALSRWPGLREFTWRTAWPWWRGQDWETIWDEAGNIVVLVGAFVMMLRLGWCFGRYGVKDGLLAKHAGMHWLARSAEAAAGILTIVASCAFLGGAIWCQLLGWTGDANDLLYFDRVVHLVSGLSPAVPALCLSIALVAWCLFVHKQYDLLARFHVRNPFENCGDTHGALADLEFHGRQVLVAIESCNLFYARRPSGHPDQRWKELSLKKALAAGLVVGLIFVLACQVGSRHMPSIDGTAFDIFIYVGLFVAAALTSLALCHFWFTWKVLQGLLHELAKLPLARAYHRLPTKIKQPFDQALYARRPRESTVELIRQQASVLAAALTEPVKNGLKRLLPADCAKVDAAAAALAAVPASGWDTDNLSVEQVQQGLHHLGQPLVVTAANVPKRRTELREAQHDALHNAFLACIRLLQSYWNSRSLEEIYADPGGAEPAPAAPEAPAAPAVAPKPAATAPPSETVFALAITGPSTTKAADPVPAWVVLAEDFVALDISRYQAQFFVHLYNLLNAVTLGAFLLLLTVTLYPFHPQSLLLVLTAGLLAAVLGVAVWVLVAINRDEFKSHLDGSTPNQFTPNLTFVKEIVQYVVPVLGLLMVQFPVVSAFVRSLLEPLLRVVR